MFSYFLLFYFWLNVIYSVFFFGLYISPLLKPKFTDGAKHNPGGSDFQRVMLEWKAQDSTALFLFPGARNVAWQLPGADHSQASVAKIVCLGKVSEPENQTAAPVSPSIPQNLLSFLSCRWSSLGRKSLLFLSLCRQISISSQSNPTLGQSLDCGSSLLALTQIRDFNLYFLQPGWALYHEIFARAFSVFSHVWKLHYQSS